MPISTKSLMIDLQAFESCPQEKKIGDHKKGRGGAYLNQTRENCKDHVKIDDLPQGKLCQSASLFYYYFCFFFSFFERCIIYTLRLVGVAAYAKRRDWMRAWASLAVEDEEDDGFAIPLQFDFSFCFSFLYLLEFI